MPANEVRTSGRTSERVRPRAPAAVKKANGRAGAADLRESLRSIRDALRAARQGDLSVRLPTDAAAGDPLVAEVGLAFNAMVEGNADVVREIERLAQHVAQGRFDDEASVRFTGGAWESAAAGLNRLVRVMVAPMVDATRILNAVMAGDLSETMPLRFDGLPLQGELLRLGEGVNGVVVRLREVSTVVSSAVRAIATEGRLGVQATTHNELG
ncbi:MAG TPA: hypothetical protein VIK91_07230, partial [Nannocystis sp.]